MSPQLLSAATIVSTLNPSDGTPRKKFLNYTLFYIQVWALQAGGLRRISQTRRSTSTAGVEREREREWASVIHVCALKRQKKKKENPPCYYKVNAVESADLGDLHRGDLWDLREGKQPEVMSERGHSKSRLCTLKSCFCLLIMEKRRSRGPQGPT